MWSSGVTFERDALYEEVWTTPLTILGKKYGMSDNGLRRVCKAMEIPLPERGHWARVAAGQKVERKYMRSTADRETFHSYRHGSGVFSDEASADRAWLKEKFEAERRPEFHIQVPMEPQEWHRAVEPLRRVLEKAQKKQRIERSKREEAERRRARLARQTGRVQPNFDVFESWARPDDVSGLLSHHEWSMLHVSHVTFQRALAVANALALAAKARGCSVKYNDEKARLEIGLEEGSLSIRIEEVQEARRPTDKLSVVAYRPSGSKWELIDDEVPVQERLNEVFVRLYRAVVSSRASARERKAYQDRLELERTQEAERARLEEIRREREAQEASRRKELLNEVSRYQQAQQIRAYVTQVGGVSDWHSWALRIADDLDPLPSRRKETQRRGGAN